MFALAIEQVTAQAWLVFAVFLRVGPAIAMAPGYGERSVPVRVRLLIGLVFATAIAPVVEPHLPPEPPSPEVLTLFVAREFLIGTFFGLFAKGIMYLLEMAGSIISQSISLSQMFPTNSEAISIMGHILTVTGLAIIFSTPINGLILESFASSYALDIPGLFEVHAFMAQKSAELLNFIFVHAVVLASGFIGVFFVYYLFTGFVNKTMPQFMITFIGVPFVSLLAIDFMRRNFEIILTTWQGKTADILTMPLGYLR